MMTQKDGRTNAFHRGMKPLIELSAPSFSSTFALLAFGLAPGKKEPIHVLMIEDDPAISDMYRLQLEHDGFRVSTATTGEIGYGQVSEHSPDVVLLDLLLPDRSGFEVLTAIHERLPGHPPVVVLSNYGEPSMIDRARALGAVEYLVKSRVTPADVSRLIPGWAEQGRKGKPRES